MKVCLSGSSFTLPTERQQQLLENKTNGVQSIGWVDKACFVSSDAKGPYQECY